MARKARDEVPASEPPKGWTRASPGNRTPNAGDDARAAARKARRLRVFELRVMRATYPQIARELGISTKQAKKDFRRAFAEWGTEDAAHYRAILNAQYDADLLRLAQIESAVAPLAVPKPNADGTVAAPDLEAVQKLAYVVRTRTMIGQAQARLNNAEVAPTVKHEHTGAGGGPIAVTLDDVERLVRLGSANADDVRAGGESVH